MDKAFSEMRGYAVIIVNEEETDNSGFKKRKGAASDADNMQRAFCTKLKFEWLNQSQYNRNVAKSEWRHEKEPPQGCGCITCKIQQTNHENSECFLFVMSSHGHELNGEQILQFSDGKKVTLSEIIETLNDQNCPSLKGKPRILILQTCRIKKDVPEEQLDDTGFEISVEGSPEQKEQLNRKISGISLEDENDATPVDENESGQGDQPENCNEANVDTEQEETGEESDPNPEEESSGLSLSLGKITNNFLIVYPTTTGKRAKRNTAEGSWLITELCEVIDEHDFETNPEMNFLTILTTATGRVAKRETGKPKPGFKNVACTVHTLTQPLIFRDVTENASTLKIPTGESDDIPEPKVITGNKNILSDIHFPHI